MHNFELCELAEHFSERIGNIDGLHERSVGNAGVDFSGCDGTVAEQVLYKADVDALVPVLSADGGGSSGGGNLRHVGFGLLATLYIAVPP